MKNNFTHEIVNGIYQIKDEGEVVLTIKLYPEWKAVQIKTKEDAFEGPINLINFAADIEK